MEDALENFPKIGEKFGELRKITQLDVDLKQDRDRLRAAGNTYKGAMVEFLENWKNMQELDVKRDRAGNAVLEICSDHGQGRHGSHQKDRQ